MKKIEIVKNFIKAYNSFNVESMLAYLHSDIEFKNISNGVENARTKGIEEFRELANNSVKMFKQREQKIISYTESDDMLNIEIIFRGILAIDLPNGLKAGETLIMNGKSTYVFKDNLIISLVDES
ncbi:MAG: nuclear transport factor 2 family protein [bacterium]|nr:nuclear transport factor 2 family protein [bacterium]